MAMNQWPLRRRGRPARGRKSGVWLSIARPQNIQGEAGEGQRFAQRAPQDVQAVGSLSKGRAPVEGSRIVQVMVARQYNRRHCRPGPSRQRKSAAVRRRCGRCRKYRRPAAGHRLAANARHQSPRTVPGWRPAGPSHLPGGCRRCGRYGGRGGRSVIAGRFQSRRGSGWMYGAGRRLHHRGRRRLRHIRGDVGAYRFEQGGQIPAPGGRDEHAPADGRRVSGGPALTNPPDRRLPHHPGCR